MRTLVVLPTFNEAATIARILGAARSALPDADVLVVDDSSPDGTGAIVTECAARLGQIHLLTRPEKNGLGNAYKAGFAWGLDRGYEALVEMDSDFSHDPADLPRLVGGLDDDTEVVIGSRYVPGGEIPDWTFSRRMISRLGNEYARFCLGIVIRDSTSGFRAYASSVLERLDLPSVLANAYGFQVEMTYLAHLAGAPMREVPIRFVDRTEGDSKMSGQVVSEAFRLVTRWGLERLVHRAPARAAARGVKVRS